MAVIRGLREIISDEYLNPSYFKWQAEGIVREFGKDFVDPVYVSEKVRNLAIIPYLVCRDKHGRGSPEVKKCVEELLGLGRLKDEVG